MFQEKIANNEKMGNKITEWKLGMKLDYQEIMFCKSNVTKNGERFLRSLDHGLLSGPDPNPGVVELLVGLVLSLGVSDLSLEVSLVLLVEHPETVPVCPLGVCVDVHLDDSVLDGRRDLLLRRAGSSVHDQEGRKVVVALELLLDVSLQMKIQIILKLWPVNFFKMRS